MPAVGYRYTVRSHLAQLSRGQVVRAREDYKSGKVSQLSLARRLGISQPAVYMLVHGITYKWVLEKKKAA